MVLRDEGFIVHSSIVFKMSSCTLETEYSRMNLSTLENDVTCAVSSRLSILVRSTIKYEKKSSVLCLIISKKKVLKMHILMKYTQIQNNFELPNPCIKSFRKKLKYEVQYGITYSIIPESF